jgi:hypothetical protein
MGHGDQQRVEPSEFLVELRKSVRRGAGDGHGEMHPVDIV